MKVGDRLEIKKDLNISNRETRWGQPNTYITHFLHSGRYIIDWIRGQKVHISDADWDDNGITFHSIKHGHIISVNDLRKVI